MASPSARLVTGIATGTLCNHTVGQSMTSLRPQQARSPSCLAVIHRRCSALAPKTRNNLSCCSVCTRPTVHGLIATELLPDSSNLCNPGWTRRCSADNFQDMQQSEQAKIAKANPQTLEFSCLLVLLSTLIAFVSCQQYN